MYEITGHYTKIISIIFVPFVLAAFTSMPAYTVRPYLPANPSCTNPGAYLELSIEPAMALPGTLVTLNIAYHRIGLPYTGIGINPPDLVVFDPPLSMPCKYGEHINGCSAITFRTQASGVG
jgi:hypothetical protein